MTERTTHKQIEGLFDRVRDQAIRVGTADAESWELDYASCYGGWRITSRRGSHDVIRSRVPAGEFYRTLHAIWYVLTDTPDR